MNKLHYKGYLKTKRVKYLVAYNAAKHIELTNRWQTVVGNIELTIRGPFVPAKVKTYLEDRNDLKDLIITNLIKL